MKKLIALLLCLVMIVGVMSTSVLAAEKTEAEKKLDEIYGKLNQSRAKGVAKAYQTVIGDAVTYLYKTYPSATKGIGKDAKGTTSDLVTAFGTALTDEFNSKVKDSMTTDQKLAVYVGAAEKAYKDLCGTIKADIEIAFAQSVLDSYTADNIELSEAMAAALAEVLKALS